MARRRGRRASRNLSASPLGAQRAGEGGLDLHGLMSALPATLPVSLEVPLDGEQGALPPLQRAQLLFDAAQPYLRACA